MVESLPTMVDTHIKEQVKKQVPEQVRDQVPMYVAEGLILERQKTKEEMERMIAKGILQERGNIQAEISSQIQKTIDNHIPSQVDTSVPQTTCRTSTVRPRDQDDPHDDAHPEGENRAKRQKTSEYEAYVSGESSSGQTTPLVQSCQRDPKAPPLSLINQDLLYLKKRSSRPEKIVLSLHKFLAIIFNDDDIERTNFAIWGNKKRPGKTKGRELFIRTQITYQVIKQDVLRQWVMNTSLSQRRVFCKRRANECIMSINEPDYNNLNKNDIVDMYLLIMNDKVPDYAETGLLWSLLVFIRSSVIGKECMIYLFGQCYVPMTAIMDLLWFVTLWCDIMRTEAYQDYVEEYGRLDFLMIQPSPVVSTQWTHRTLSAPSLILLALWFLYEMHPVNTTQELIVHKIDDQIPAEQDEQMDEGEYVEANTFIDDMVLSQPIHDDDHIDHTLIRNGKTGPKVKKRTKRAKKSQFLKALIPLEGPDKLNGSLQPIKDDSQDV
ncbi:hypothetical protein Tco_0458500 [Tanacetum coccineum]